MPDLRPVRNRFRIILGALIVLCLACLVLLMLPYRRTAGAFNDEYQQTRVEMQTKVREVAPLRNIDQKIHAADGNIAAFERQRLAPQQSAVATELGRLSRQHHVGLSQLGYDIEGAPISNLRRVKIEADLSGNYAQVVKFINALERDKMFFIISSVELNEEAREGDVRLKLKLETFLRS